MRTHNRRSTQTTYSTSASGKGAEHAVVVGSSIAGLLAARVLLEYVDRVTLVDRDCLDDTPEFRRGVPQAHHPHTLLWRGQQILEQRFPGLTDELLTQGAISIDASTDVAYYIAGKWRTPRRHEATVSIAGSRPLLETTLYRRIRSHPRVTIRQEHDVVDLIVDRQRTRVTGVRLRDRRHRGAGQFDLAADLVVDASGRSSRAPRWLAYAGYQPPRETIVDAFTGYSSRVYRQPANRDESWHMLYVRPTPPFGSRGGMIIPMEDDRWHVALIGMAGDYPPTTDKDYLEFARSLPTQALYAAIRDAEPLTEPHGYRRTANRRRHYEELPQYLEGLLVYGDAAYVLNPVYAQGITAAALGSGALERALQAQTAGSVLGLAGTFQHELSVTLDSLWRQTTRADFRWPATEETEQTPATVARVPAFVHTNGSARSRRQTSIATV